MPIPEHTHSALQRYVHDRVPPGSFLEGVLTNNLMMAVMHADDINQANLVDTVRYVFNEIPAGCWGSKQAYKEWLDGER